MENRSQRRGNSFLDFARFSVTDFGLPVEGCTSYCVTLDRKKSEMKDTDNKPKIGRFFSVEIQKYERKNGDENSSYLCKVFLR